MTTEQAQPIEGGPLDGRVRPLAERMRRWIDGDVEQTASALIKEAADEIGRLNKWCDGFADASLKERATGEAYQREMKDQIAEVAVRLAKDATYRHRAAEDLLRIAGRNLDRAA